MNGGLSKDDHGIQVRQGEIHEQHRFHRVTAVAAFGLGLAADNRRDQVHYFANDAKRDAYDRHCVGVSNPLAIVRNANGSIWRGIRVDAAFLAVQSVVIFAEKMRELILNL